MSDADHYFIHTIVGAPVTVLLGRRMIIKPTSVIGGVEISLNDGRHWLDDLWRAEALLRRPDDPALFGKPRGRPGPLRRWIERHALRLALSGWLAALLTAAAWGWIHFA
jgi:hypothetical protein